MSKYKQIIKEWSSLKAFYGKGLFFHLDPFPWERATQYGRTCAHKQPSFTMQTRIKTVDSINFTIIQPRNKHGARFFYMKKVVFSLVFIFVFASFLYADYYDGTEGLYGDELKTALYNIIKGHTEYTYADLRDYILINTDEDPDNSNNVILVSDEIHGDLIRRDQRFFPMAKVANTENMLIQTYLFTFYLREN